MEEDIFRLKYDVQLLRDNPLVYFNETEQLHNNIWELNSVIKELSSKLKTNTHPENKLAYSNLLSNFNISVRQTKKIISAIDRLKSEIKTWEEMRNKKPPEPKIRHHARPRGQHIRIQQPQHLKSISEIENFLGSEPEKPEPKKESFITSVVNFFKKLLHMK